MARQTSDGEHKTVALYSNVVFPWLCDLFLDRPFLAEHRRKQLQEVRGEILEIGVGTGLNLPHYPPQVRRIVAVEPNLGMRKRLTRRSQAAGIEVDARAARGEELPFGDASFDNVVSTLTLCSIADVERAISEVHRVLKPGGCLVFFEHGLSPEPQVARRQRRLNWLQRRVGGGCRLDLDVGRAMASQPFRTLRIENFHLENSPRTHGYIYCGAAVK